MIGEDTEAVQRLADLGVEIWFDPSVRTAHLGHRTLSFMLRDHFRRGARFYRFLLLTGRRSSPRSFARIVGSSAVLFMRRTRSTLATCRRYGRDERWRVLLSLPFILAARAAGAAGRASEELRPARPSPRPTG